MQLIKINKARYRKHLNYVIVACVIAFAAGSLMISQGLIALFPDESGSHFHWNLTGVVITGLLIGFTLNKYRHHPFMKEVVYVWDLKQTLNRINRRLTKLKDAAEDGNVKAMIALQYSYSGSRLLWELDDNNIVLEELTVAQAELDVLANKYQLDLDPADFDESSLKQF